MSVVWFAGLCRDAAIRVEEYGILFDLPVDVEKTNNIGEE
tara:strand:+ start:2303 stop:2422 length:120 start_codon:yes stop_codon:yes gene_type:complete